MKVTVNKDKCIGCGTCPCICPEVFDLNGDGFAYVKIDDKEVDKEHEKETKEAVESCPTGAIEEIK